jgi:hypothetical protein
MVGVGGVAQRQGMLPQIDGGGVMRTVEEHARALTGQVTRRALIKASPQLLREACRGVLDELLGGDP